MFLVESVAVTLDSKEPEDPGIEPEGAPLVTARAQDTNFRERPARNDPEPTEPGALFMPPSRGHWDFRGEEKSVTVTPKENI